MIEAGFPEERVAVLAGGIKAWHRAGFPIVKWTDAPKAETSDG